MTREISLDPRLAADSIAIGKLALCEVRLQDDARFPWLVLVPQRENVSELFELAEPDQAAAMEEIARVSAALRAVTQCLKINVGALGNIVDRVRLGYVVDYADLHFGTFRPFMIFNVADACITIGVLLLVARALLVQPVAPSNGCGCGLSAHEMGSYGRRSSSPQPNALARPMPLRMD